MVTFPQPKAPPPPADASARADSKLRHRAPIEEGPHQGTWSPHSTPTVRGIEPPPDSADEQILAVLAGFDPEQACLDPGRAPPPASERTWDTLLATSERGPERGPRRPG